MSITSTSLLTKAQVTPGEKIPTLTVKETNPGETITLDLKGKNIIVRPMFSRFPSYMLMSNVAALCRSAYLARSPLRAARKFPATSRSTTSSRQRV